MATIAHAPGGRTIRTDGAVYLASPQDLSQMLHLRKKQIFAEFHSRCSLLLTRSCREYLMGILKEYQMYRQIEKLVSCLRSLLDTPAKLDLLKDIRYFISGAHLNIYDRLVPYHNMACPWQKPYNSPLPRSPRRRVNITPHRTASRRSVAMVTDGYTARHKPDRDAPPVQMISLVRGVGDPLGFSIRGGSEHGLAVFVSHVEANSAAERAGLRAGDKVLEVNNVAFDNIASSGAAAVLTSSLRLKILVRQLHKIPRFKSAMEKTSWYDVQQNVIVEGDLVEHGKPQSPPTSVDDTQRDIDLSREQTSKQRVLGFNIRGGSEYALGLYVSKVDEKGLADLRGLKLGDEIVVINKRPCTNIRHSVAVRYIQSQRQLLLTVKGVGKYPAFKEIFAEYEWTDTVTNQLTKTRDAGAAESLITEYPQESRVESYAQTDDEDHSDSDGAVDVPISHPMDIAIQTDSECEPSTDLLPKRSDIELRPAQNGPTPGKPPALYSEEIEREQMLSRPMLAVRAMELETKAKHPELNQQQPRLSALDHDRPLQGHTEVADSTRARALKDIFLGGKFKGKKSSVQGSKHGSRPEDLGRTIKSHTSGTSEASSTRPVGRKPRAPAGTVETSVNKVLHRTDEAQAVLRHIKTYETDRDVRSLLERLAAILDSHKKCLLLRDIRSEILDVDLPEFDRAVVRLEQRRLYEAAMRDTPGTSATWLHISTIPSDHGSAAQHDQVQGKTHQVNPQPHPAASHHGKNKYQVHRPKVRSTGNKALPETWTHPDTDPSPPDQRPSSISQEGKDVNVSDRIQSYSGPFLEDNDLKISERNDPNYAEIEDLLMESRSDRSRGDTVGSDADIASALDILSEAVREESAGSSTKSSPVYATVKKRTVQPDPLPDMSYINIDNTYATVEDVTGEDTSHKNESSGDIGEADSRSYVEVTNALRFLDDLDDGSESGGYSTVPQSESSSIAESRYGSYDIFSSVSDSSSRRSVPEKGSVERAAPRFIPPPPPEDSPPPRIPIKNLRPQQDPVTDISYTQRQTSLDYSSRRKFESVPSTPKYDRNGQLSTPADTVPTDTTRQVRSCIVLSKKNKSLGFSISGGQDSKTQPDVRIQDVLPGVQAATLQGQIKSGLILEAVDGINLIGVTHSQAVNLICNVFNDKQRPIMELHVREPAPLRV